MTARGGDPRDRTDVQRSAIDSAAEVFERFAAQLDDLDAPGGAGVPRAREAVVGAVSLFADVVLRILDGYADLVERGERDASAATTDGSPITLRGSPGQRVEAPIWIHNGTDTPVTGVVLRITRLTAPDGAEIASSVASCCPAELDVAATASGHSSLGLTIPAVATGGIYHGHVLATGIRDAALPVRLVVEP